MSYYDDNFGAWHGTDDAEVRDFYRQVQRRSVRKVCQGCGHTVRIMPHYAYCNGCAEILERGGELPEWTAPAPAAVPQRRELPLTEAERRSVAAWKMERAVHRKAAKEAKEAAERWNRSLAAAAPKPQIRRRPKGQD